MTLTQLTTSDLTKIAKLLERKEALQSKIAEIDRSLLAFEKSESGSPRSNGGATRQSSGGRARKRAPRGGRKERIIAELKDAGQGGVKIKDLADKLHTKYGNISVWFQTTGKKMKEIKKVGPARYAWVD